MIEEKTRKHTTSTLRRYLEVGWNSLLLLQFLRHFQHFSQYQNLVLFLHLLHCLRQRRYNVLSPHWQYGFHQIHNIVKRQNDILAKHKSRLFLYELHHNQAAMRDFLLHNTSIDPPSTQRSWCTVRYNRSTSSSTDTKKRPSRRAESKGSNAIIKGSSICTAFLLSTLQSNKKTSILSEVKALRPRIYTIEADPKRETIPKSVLASPEFAYWSKPACRICCLPSRYFLRTAIPKWETADSRGTWPFLALYGRWNREDNSWRWSKASFGCFAERFRGFPEWGWNNSLKIRGNGERNGNLEKEGVSLWWLKEKTCWWEKWKGQKKALEDANSDKF